MSPRMVEATCSLLRLGGWGDLNRDRSNVMASLAFSEVQRTPRHPSRLRAEHVTAEPWRLARHPRHADRHRVCDYQFHTGISRDNLDKPAAAPAPWIPQNPSLRVNGINHVDPPNGPGYAGLDGMGPYDEVLLGVPPPPSTAPLGTPAAPPSFSSR